MLEPMLGPTAHRDRRPQGRRFARALGLLAALTFFVPACSTVLTTWESHKFRKRQLIKWVEKEHRELPEWLSKVPGCPTTLPEGSDRTPPGEFYHKGAAAELRLPAKGQNVGQQCTYDADGKFIEGHKDGHLIRGTLAPGTSDRSVAGPRGMRKNLRFLLDLKHFDQDVSWFASARLLDGMDPGGACTLAYLHVRPPPLGDGQPGSVLVKQMLAYEGDYRDAVARCRANGRASVVRVRLMDLAMTRGNRATGDAAWAFGMGSALELDSDRWRLGLGYRLDFFDTPRSDVRVTGAVHLGKWVTVGVRGHALVSGFDVADTALAVGAIVDVRDAIAFELKWIAAGGQVDEAGQLEFTLTLTPWFKGF